MKQSSKLIWVALAASVSSGLRGQVPTNNAFDDPVFSQQLPPLAPIEPQPPIAPPATPADPAIDAPLPPLAQFNSAPPADIKAAASENAPSLRYRVDVHGLKEVGLEDEFRGLSALLDKGRKADNAAQVSARADEDVALIGRILKSQGYYDGSATADIGPVVDQKGELPVVLTIAPGKRYALGNVSITGAEPEPTGIARTALGLATRAPILAADIEAAEARVALRLPEDGYPFAKVGQRDIVLDDATHLGDYTLPIDSGRKSSFGGIRTAGDPVFDARHVAIFPRFRAGELYDSRKVDDLRQALVGTSLFTTVAVEPVGTGTIAPDGTETVDLIVTETKGPWRSLAGSAGYGTGEGIKLQGSFTHRNLFPPEGALTVSAVAGTLEQSLSTIFRRSNAGQRDRALQLGASVARQRFDAYNAQTINFSGSLSRASTPIWQKRWTYSIGTEAIATRESRFDAVRSARADTTYFIAALPLQLGYDRSNNLLDPTRGFRLTARVSPEAQKRSGGGFGGYGRTLFEGTGYYPVANNIVLAARARVGSIFGAARDDIAPSRRLYSGGGGSVRGYGYQELGPKDAQGDPVGGRSLTEFAGEIRYRFGNFGIVPFFDAGRVGESSTPSLSGMRYGAGIGGRYYTNFGPMRIDVATPLGRKAGEPTVAVYLSIGQAF